MDYARPIYGRVGFFADGRGEVCLGRTCQTLVSEVSQKKEEHPCTARFCYCRRRWARAATSFPRAAGGWVPAMVRVVMARRLLHPPVVVTRPLPACWTACVPNGQPGSRIVAPRPPLLRRNQHQRHRRQLPPPLLPPAAIPVPNGSACWTAFVLVWLLASTKTAASPARAVAPPRAITNRLPVPPRRRKCPNPRRKSPHRRPAIPTRRPLPSRCRLQSIPLMAVPPTKASTDTSVNLFLSRPPCFAWVLVGQFSSELPGPRVFSFLLAGGNGLAEISPSSPLLPAAPPSYGDSGLAPR